MSQFSVERLKNLKLTECRKDYNGKITKVYSASKDRWIIMSMFPSTSQAEIKRMFKKND